MRNVIFSNRSEFHVNVMDDAVLWTMNTLSQLYWQSMLTTESIFSSSVIGSNIHLTSDKYVKNKLSISNFCIGCDKEVVVPKPELALPPIINTPETSPLLSPRDASVLSKSDDLNNHPQTNRRSSIQWLRGTMQSTQKLVLKDIINNASACSVFKEFLEKENASHLLTFLLEIEECRGVTVPGFRVIYFKQIYFKYLHPLGMLMVPISDESRNLVMRELESDCVLGPIAFKHIVDDVLHYMDTHFMIKLVFMNISALLSV